MGSGNDGSGAVITDIIANRSRPSTFDWPSKVLAEALLLDLAHELADRLFVVLVGHERGSRRVYDDTVLQSHCGDEVVAGTADDTAAGAHAGVLARDGVAVGVAAAQSGD